MKPTDDVTINTTFKMMCKHVNEWENLLRENLEVVDFKIISNTEKLYAEDDNFKKLVKTKKEATKQCELYINRHNGK